MRPCALIILLAAIGLLLSGCWGQTRPYVRAAANSNFSYKTTGDLSPVSRVVVMPTWVTDSIGRSHQRLDEAMPSAMRDLGRFDIITTDHAARDAVLDVDPLLRGSIPLETLILVRETYRADALLVSRCDRFDSYDPIAVALQSALISCHDGSVLWQASGLFDGGTKAIQEDIRAWHERVRGVGLEDIAGWRGTLHSPRLFARYVSDRMAGSILAPPPPPRASSSSAGATAHHRR